MSFLANPTGLDIKRLPNRGKDQILRLLRIDINRGEAFDMVEELQTIEEYIKWYNIERI
ncbi:IS3 family transposase [Corynebacterium marquesiae]|uniref:IS3 family transposase n=1 Tax=Corynebacterium marquesiae TaxID=2913503 RepID=UPI0032F0690C